MSERCEPWVMLFTRGEWYTLHVHDVAAVERACCNVAALLALGWSLNKACVAVDAWSALDELRGLAMLGSL